MAAYSPGADVYLILAPTFHHLVSSNYNTKGDISHLLARPCTHQSSVLGGTLAVLAACFNMIAFVI